jgi:hypothetical protein
MNTLSLRFLVVSSVLASLGLSGCAGIVFSGNKTPFGFIYANASTNEMVTQNPLTPKEGQACASSILGWVTTGDASVATAAKAGSVSKIASVDHTFTNILGVYSKYCVVVTGE